jgi:hypothetical protein
MRRRQHFVVPDLSGPVTGGTLFNRLLIAALQRIGWPCSVLAPTEAATTLACADGDDDIWIDTLYLDDFPMLAARAAAGVRVGLLAHYLPSLVRLGDGVRADELSSAEAHALASAHLFLVPSAFMRATVFRLTATRLPILCVEPGHLAQKGDVIAGPPARAALVANLLPGKGIEPFLTSLAARIRDSDTFHLSIVGGASFDPNYADRCTALGQDSRLRGRVRFLGALSPLETVRLMADCNLVLSTSTMEAYGMAIAEARTLGLPIVARAGGNVDRLVEASSGGEVVGSADQLAESFLVVCRNENEHARRLDQARAHALPPRSWTDAALDFEVQMLASSSSSSGEPPMRTMREGAHED